MGDIIHHPLCLILSFDVDGFFTEIMRS